MSVRAALALLAAAMLALGLAGPAAALTADEMYEPEAVVVVDLQLPPASVAALEAEPAEYVEGSFSLAPTDGTPAGIGTFSAPLTVGIRLKGEGSFRDLSGKAAFKLKFNEFVKGQKFLGLKRMTLNNMVQDPSMVHETLAYAAFRAAGVPAPRTGYADVRVNAEEFGMHLNLETLDDVALERLFGSFEAPPQHLYEGQVGVDVLPGETSAFEVDEGEEDDRSDLEALIEAVAASSPSFSERMAGHADLGELTRMWAVERYLAHWDGYSTQPHNYYLYSDPLGIFQMMPSGADQTWSLPQLGFGPPGASLFESCFGEPECLALYKGALLEAEQVVSALGPGAEAQQLAALLAPWQQLEVAPRKPFGPDVIAAEVAEVGTFAAKRPAALAKWLEGKPEGGDSGGEPAAGAGSAQPKPAPALSPRLQVDRAQLGRGMFVARIEAPPGSRAHLSAFIATGRGRVPACIGSAGPLSRIAVQKTGTLTHSVEQPLRCRLSPTVRRHLSVRWLRLRVLVTVELPGQPPAGFQRAIRLPRTAG
ncbi:MAG TPA: CotH kinase family protein [Solirubrobacterales bacterium]